MISGSAETSAIRVLERKINVLDESLKQNVMSLNASEKARKSAESKLKQLNEQVRDVFRP